MVDRKEYGAKVDLLDNEKRTPFHLAVETKNLVMCRLLVENGASGYIKNQDGLTPIDIAMSERDRSLLEYFRSVSKFGDYFR